MPGNRVGVPCICCKACCNANTVAMPSMANALVRVPAKANRARTPITAAYRCLGTDAYRFGGERLCQNTQVRTDLLDLAVWQEVCTLLAHPERLAEEYRRRLQPGTRTKRTPLSTVKGSLRPG